jgi:Na+-driven multidrug efflux pump
MMALGLAPFAMQFASSIVMAIMNQSLGTYGGDIAISGMGIVMGLMMLIMMPIFGINQGAQPIIGYNYGAQQFDRVKATLKYAGLAATLLATTWFVVIRLFPIQLVSIFGNQNAELIAFGSHALLVVFTCLPIIAFQVVGAGYFQAVGRPKQSLILGMSRQVLILIPALLILPRFFQLDGVLMAGPVADLAASIITGLWLYFDLRGLKQRKSEGLGGEMSVKTPAEVGV